MSAAAQDGSAPRPGYDEESAMVASGWTALVLGVIVTAGLTPRSEDPVELYVSGAAWALAYGFLMPAMMKLTRTVDVLAEAPRVQVVPSPARARAVRNGCARIVVPLVAVAAAMVALDLVGVKAPLIVIPGFLFGAAIAAFRATRALRRREEATAQRVFVRDGAPPIGWTHAQAMSQYVLVEPPTHEEERAQQEKPAGRAGLLLRGEAGAGPRSACRREGGGRPAEVVALPCRWVPGRSWATTTNREASR